MRYLSVFISKQPTKPIVVVDLNKLNVSQLSMPSTTVTFMAGMHMSVTNKNIFTAKFDRRSRYRGDKAL